ncbi:RPE-retinal G protein-coupled receptor isoform X2 [Arvicanthis niloticus]|uniref:RPE-retinal G protein-coupled receptor isoform X2 n=1 Tax=Arvicanthis niloticus TaxID=61156 RepID=UPI00402BBCFD
MAATRALPAGFGELEVLAVGTVLLMEALSGISLNGLTIFSFCKTPDLRTPINLLVLSLALADTGISLNALVAAVSSLLRRWPHGSEGCQVHGFQGFATALASICGSAAIAWGRYHHYCTRRQLAWDTAIPLVLFVWLSSAFWASLPLMGWGHYDYEPVGTCCTLDYSKGDRCLPSLPKPCPQSTPSTMHCTARWSVEEPGNACLHKRARRTEPSETLQGADHCQAYLFKPGLSIPQDRKMLLHTSQQSQKPWQTLTYQP